MKPIDTITAGPSGLADLKRAHRGTWASGSYAAVAERLILEPPYRLIERIGLEPGLELLDIATGTGNAAIPAAIDGARVTGLDLTPELLDQARERAAVVGVDVEWVEGDAEDLAFEDESFDRVVSTFGVQFAPRHEVVAREMVRVTRPGGIIGLVNWTPQGLIGQVLKAVGKRMPKPPGYASPPPLWGDEEHVRGLLGSEAEVEFQRKAVWFDDFVSAEDWVSFMEAAYGPMLKAREKLAPEGRWQELRDELVEIVASLDIGEAGRFHIEAEYLIAVARVPER
ncbi:MAG TPA: methyltransferase domain-containing protein [Solirubrobacterales bacterium]|nr:methyltransferase domain-containing protein [Solirubrobacterales bacterium]